MSVPFTGLRWCWAKSIHRSFASHPAAGALCLVPGAHATVGEVGSRQTGMNVVCSSTTQYQRRPVPAMSASEI